MTLYHDHMTVVNDCDRLLTALVDVTSRLALHAPRGNSDVLDKAKLAIGNRGTHALAVHEHVWSDSPDVSDRHCVSCFASDAKE
jgi:hypothetical protein